MVSVAELSGHENPALVLRVYGHMVANGEDRARRTLESAWNDGRQTGRALSWARLPLSEAQTDLVAGVGFEPFRGLSDQGHYPQTSSH